MARLVCNLAWFFLACGFAFGQASPESVDHEWRSYGHDPGGMRFSRLSQIDRANVQKLQRIWTYHTGETNWSSFSGPQHIQAFETTPLMVRSEEHTSELQSRLHLVCRLLLEKKKHRPFIQYNNVVRVVNAAIFTGTS